MEARAKEAMGKLYELMEVFTGFYDVDVDWENLTPEDIDKIAQAVADSYLYRSYGCIGIDNVEEGERYEFVEDFEFGIDYSDPWDPDTDPWEIVEEIRVRGGVEKEGSIPSGLRELLSRLLRPQGLGL